MEEIVNVNVSISQKRGILSKLYEFKGEKYFNLWDCFEFVRRYGMYVDERIDFMVFDKMWLRKNLKFFEVIYFSGMLIEKVLIKMEQLQSLFEWVFVCRFRFMSKYYNKIVFFVIWIVVEESFQIYSDICEGLSVLLD